MSMMNEIDEVKRDRSQSFLPLEEWATLSFFCEKQQIRIENSSPGYGNSGHPLDVQKRARQERVQRVVSVAKKLVDRLILGDNDSSENASDSGETSILHAEEISLDNIMVFPTTFEVEDEDSMTRGQMSASEIIDKCCIEEIKAILASFDQVDFTTSYLRRKITLDGNATNLQSDYFRKIGLLMFKLLIPETSRNPSLDLALSKYAESSGDDDIGQQSDYRDEEEPGAEKGRRKHTITETCKTFRRVSISTAENELQKYFIPKSICRLVGDLVEQGVCGDKMFFDKLSDVSMDLSQMIEDPQRFLFNENIAKDGLEFKDDLLCGRNSELVELLNAMAVARMESRSFINSIIAIGGEPGVGKSHLLRSVKDSLTRNGWTCLQCKFDRQSRNQSCSAVSMAFDNFFQHIAVLKSRLEDEDQLDSEEELLELISSIEDSLNATGIVALSTMIPSFRSLFPDLFRRVVEDDEDVISIESNNGGSPDIDRNGENCDTTNNGEEDCLEAHTFKSRLHYLFKKLVHAISNPENPMLLVLDDLHWADSASLDLISSLVMSNRQLQLMGDGAEDSPHCLVVAGTFRSDEIDINKLFGDYFRSDTVRVTNINLVGMEIAGTNAMLSYTVQLPLRLIRELACVVHAKTLGNPLFIKEFMNSLVAEKALKYSLVEARWLWDIDTVKSKSVDVSVANIMTRKILHMPKVHQFALTVASCFGMRVDEEILQHLEKSKKFKGLVHSLEKIIMNEGMIQKIGTCVTFQHDLIQQAVYNLIDSKEMDELHYSIGVHLLKSLISSADYAVDKISLIAIDQINVASSVIVESSLRSPLASLNLSASQHMIEMAKPVSALLYVQHGLRHLGPEGWVHNFDICLRLHESGCLSSYLNGIPKGVETHLEEIMNNTTGMMDRIKSIYVLIRTLGTSGRQEVAVEKAFHFLRLLGEDFPDELSLIDIQSALSLTKQKLANYSLEQILTSLPRLTDEKKQWSMSILDVILPYVYTVCPNYLPLIACRMVDISLASGLCRESASGFFHVGLVAIGYLGEIQYGYQLSKVSNSVLRLFNAKSLYPKMKCLINGFVSFWVEPLQSTAMSLAQSYEEGLMVGDVEYAMIGSTVSCMQNIACGRDLLVMEKEMDGLVSQMAHLNQTYNLFGLISMHKAVCLLAGSQKDLFRASFIPMKDEDEVVSKFASMRPSLVQAIYFHRIYVAIFHFRGEDVLKLSEKYQSISQRKATTYDVFVVFFQGLSALQFSRLQHNTAKWHSIGMDALHQFQTWAMHSEWNFENKLLLLEAEIHFSKGEHGLAEDKYYAAIESARRHRFVHEEGLSYELLSNFYKSRGEDEKEREFMMNAILCYRKWGANGLLAQPRFESFTGGEEAKPI